MTNVQIVVCPTTGNLGGVPVGTGSGQFGWQPLESAFNKSTTANVGPFSTVETIVAQSSKIPANTLVAGSTVRVTIYGQCTSSAGNQVNVIIRFGAAGTTADANVGGQGVIAATSGTNIFFRYTVLLLVTGTGTTVNPKLAYELLNVGVTGINTAATFISQNNGNAVLNTTIAGFFSATLSTAAGTTTLTGLPPSLIEIVKI